MKRILLYLFSVVATQASAQNHLAGVNLGLNLTDVSADNFFDEHRPRVGFSGGLTYTFLFANRFSLGTGLNYSQRGFLLDMVFTDETGQRIGDKHAVRYQYDYLSLPLKGGVYFGNRLRGFVNLGVIPAFLAQAKTITPVFRQNGEATMVFDVTSQVNRFDFAGLAEIGGAYVWKGRYWLLASLAYRHSLTSFTNSAYFANSEVWHRGLNLSVGVSYLLGGG